MPRTTPHALARAAHTSGCHAHAGAYTRAHARANSTSSTISSTAAPTYPPSCAAHTCSHARSSHPLSLTPSQKQKRLVPINPPAAPAAGRCPAQQRLACQQGPVSLQGWARPLSSGAPARTRTPRQSQTPAAAAAPAARSACVQVVEQSTCAQLRPSPWSASAPRQPSRSGHGWTGRSGCCRTPQQSQQSGSGR
jgi:hypothetical protein